ncbi:FAD:protein FMN transferase [Mycobacterium sp. CVI_P3]|uniref:FAD:protein FMN transferase n=1 Tax=Mycobacterium pinniadriaticum TaxID=2994102 RepID=A0ABT3S7S3_9MYCO|nr:FAD:protein FMN transferase [Mycobacterium pinniadriaticum]MCX2929130.1 FAD:protein FMN transferase [Mycobacterium pinniadriaticum]MCX2935555.1 FAD:protein FMN transferase [Mycobacterium pinniadriaticum]
MVSTLVSPGQSQWSRWSTDMHLLVTQPATLPAARAVVDAELDAVETAASRFRPDSEICGLAGGVRTPVSPLLAHLIEDALAAARFTDGDVDPTVGSAMIALGYDRDIGQLDRMQPRVASLAVAPDWSMVEFDGRTVRLPAGVVLDLGATAKAAAADRCARRVHGQTGSGVLVNLGGDIATAGPAPEGGWQVLVQDTDDDPASRVTLGSDAGLATSSTSRRRWWNGGDVVHHIIDPRTGRSAEPVWRSVSVAADNCLAANTISTAAIIRGHRAPDWVAALGVPARFVERDGTVRTVGGWPQ